MDKVTSRVLSACGLDRYRVVFEREKIDDEVVGTLTLDDLASMGIEPLGHRLRILRAIRAEVGLSALEPYKFLGRFHATAASLAADLAAFWDEGVKRIGRGEVLRWVRESLHDDDIGNLLEDIGEDTQIGGEVRLAVCLLALDPKTPLCWRGSTVTEKWVTDHPEDAAALLEGSAGLWLQRLRGESWLAELADRYRSIADHLDCHHVPANPPRVVTSALLPEEEVVHEATELASHFVSSPEPFLSELLASESLGWLDSAALVSAKRSLLLTPEESRTEESLGNLRRQGFVFDESLARQLFASADWSVVGPRWEDRRRQSVASSNPRLEALLELDKPDLADAIALVAADQKYFWSVNSLGMRFVRVPGLNASFCIWPTRVQDFAEFAREAGSKVRSPDFEQSAAHPAVCVSWHDALAFCHWLTEQEHASGSLPENEEYRLPTDLEWSAAVGLPPEVGSKPRERHESTPTHFPWGATWPPPPNAGNYSQRLRVDEFPFTSAVGSFPANPIGIHDLGGNVWEWCSDDFDENGTESLRVLRGASWFYGEQEYLRSCFRNRSDPRYSNGNIGFRCVVGLKKA